MTKNSQARDLSDRWLKEGVRKNRARGKKQHRHLKKIIKKKLENSTKIELAVLQVIIEQAILFFYVLPHMGEQLSVTLANKSNYQML